MADIIDKANERMEEHISDSLSALRRERGTPDTPFCVDCGLHIASRQDLIPWATRCVDCQEDHEKWLRHWGE